MAEFRVVAPGLRFPEAPVALADGSVLVGEIAAPLNFRLQHRRRSRPTSRG